MKNQTSLEIQIFCPSLRMFKYVCVLVLMLAAGVSAKLDPSPDFDVTSFAINWNVVGLFSTDNLGLQFYSCASLNVTAGTLNRLTLSLNYIDTNQNKYVESSRTVVSSPLNKAILISTVSPSNQNNFVVTYYDPKNGEAIIINYALTFGYILSKNENPNFNNLKVRASQALVAQDMSLDNVTFIFNNNCDSRSLKTLGSFDPSKLSGKYYGNAVYTNTSLLQNLKCYNFEFQTNKNLIASTKTLIYTNGKTIYTQSKHLPEPQQPSVLIDTQIKNIPPVAIIYADAASKTFVAASGDGSHAYIFSPNPSLSSDVLSQVQQALTQSGMVVKSDNFFVLDTTCKFGSQIVL